MKIYINGKDGGGWAIDMIREDISNALQRLKIKQTKNFFNADIIHNIWWNRILDWKYFHLRFKKNVLLTAVNFIDLDDDNYFMKEKFLKANKFIKAWIAPSSKQKQILDKHCENVFVLPYYINYDLFDDTKYINKKAEVLKKYNIPKELTEGRVIISSFQRDTDGSDLSKPKWQKGPELLIELLKDLPKDKFVLLLASSRRHYVINECKKYGINYFYLGKEMEEDDIEINNLPLSSMPELYSITDLYLVTSKSEGGPKAILEAVAMKTFIMSTDVGLAADFLPESCLFADTKTYKKAVADFVENFYNYQNKIILIKEKNFEKGITQLNRKHLDNQLLMVYECILNER